MTVLALVRPSIPRTDGDEDRDLHPRLLQWVEDHEDYFKSANERAQRDRDYYDGRQWTEDEADAREELGRAVICNNQIGKKIRFLLGYEQKNRTDPKALPRTPAHEKTAETVTEGLRYVADAERFDQLASRAFGNLLIEGIEAIEVVGRPATDPRQRGQMDVCLRLIPWDRLIYDPYGREMDFSDARYLGRYVWLDRDEAMARFPWAEDMIGEAYSGEGDEPYEDRPKWKIGHQNRRRVRFVELYFQLDASWLHAIFTQAGFVTPPQPSPWRDDQGRPTCPIVAACALVNRENERYGLVREMIDLQDEVNVRHSNAIDFLSMRQTIGTAGAVKDVNAAKRELARPRGHVEISSGLRFEILPTTDLSQGNLEALSLARQEIQQLGPNASMLGKEQRDLSGRAIIAQQEGGLFEIAPVLDAHRDWKLRVFREVWSRIKQLWREPKWIRVTDDEKKLQWIGFNVPVTYGQVAQRKYGQVPTEMMARYGALLNEVSHVENRLAELDIDIILDDTPQAAVLQQEQFGMLVDLAKLGASLGQRIPFKPIILSSQLRDKDKLVAAIEDDMQGANQQAAQQQQILAANKQAETEQRLAAAHKAHADATLTELRTQIEAIQAQLRQLLPLLPPQGPPQGMPPGAMPPGMPAPPNSPPPGAAGVPPAATGAPVPMPPPGSTGVPIPQGAPPMEPPPPGVPPGVVPSNEAPYA